ncbi:MAG TPA: energy transducer TonB [Gammaproteobacteria bacterium]|nr:energy transducer TonB [Gammaproteobacteria bacterium]
MVAEYQDRTVTRAVDAPKPPEPAKVRDILEYRVGLDETLPPTPLRDLLSASGANVFVLSVDAELQDTVQRAGGDQYPVYPVADWHELRAAIEGGRCGIAVLDAALLGPALARRIAELERFEDRLVTLVAADRTDAQNLIGFLSDRKIHRLLIKPPALGITRLLLESAVSRCIQLRERIESPPAPLVVESRPRVAATPGSGMPRLPAWLLATALAALTIGAVLVASFTPYWPGGRTGEPAVAPAPAAEQSAPPADRFADLLARAERAFMEGRLAEPSGDNALDYYLTVLAVDPAHAVARERLTMVLDALFAQAEAGLLDGSLDSVGAALAAVRRADPQSSRLAFLNAQLERARATEKASATARAAEQRPAAPPPAVPAAAESAAGRPGELDSLLTIAAARMQRGQLVEPAGDSARDYIARAAQVSPSDAGVVRARADLSAALVAAAGVVVKAGNVDASAALLDEARKLGAKSDSLALVENEVAVARSAQGDQRRAAMLATARQRLASGALIAPAGASALDQLLALEAEAADSAEAGSLWAELTQALTSSATAALGRGDPDGAEPWIAALARSGRDPAAADALRRQLDTMRLRRQYLTDWAPAGELNLLKPATPVYPRAEQLSGLEGWVELEFVVDVNGKPREIRTVDSQPAGHFERAALAAVAQYQYEPFARGGEVFERLVRLRIRFTLQ